MEHEIIVAIVAAFGLITATLITAVGALVIAKNTAKVSAHKKELEELARRTARKAEIVELKRIVEELRKENSALKRRITYLTKALREIVNGKKEIPKQ